MERKHFKCYACQKSNNFYVEEKRIGNCCKFCGTYNYYINKKRQNNNNNDELNINQTENPIERIEIMSQNSLINNNIYSNDLDENSPLLLNNIQNNADNINNYNDINFQIDYNFILNMEPINKYEWLEKVKANKDIIERNGKDFICSICYEKFKENDDIHITKCEHIFHYLCIEKAIDNNFYDCPLCRANIKNGKKKNINEVNNASNNNIENNNEYIFVNNNNSDNERYARIMPRINIQNNQCDKCMFLKYILYCFLILIWITLGIIIVGKK